MKVMKIIAGAVAVLIALIIVAKSVTTIETGHRGVKVIFGKPGNESLLEGLYFINPFTTNMEQLDVRVQRWEDKTQAYTRDVQQATLQFVLTYRLEPTKAHVVYRDVGRSWAQTLIGQVIFEEMKREIGQHEAVDLIAQRDQAARTIEANVKRTLTERDIQVTGFQLTNIDYTTEFEQSVEAKVIAQQKAIEEQNRTVQVKEQATQRIETARGTAEATLLQAKAEAESIEIRARALNSNAKLVEWEAVQKWNGVMPQYVMGNSIPLINLPGGK